MLKSLAGDSEPHPASRSRQLRWVLAAALVLGASFGAAWLYLKFRIEELPYAVRLPPAVEFEHGRAVVRYPHAVFVTTVATFQDELFAYLMYQHYRVAKEFQGDELLLRYIAAGEKPRYEAVLVLNSDLAGAVERAAALNAAHRIQEYSWRLLADRGLADYRSQTRLFISAYNLPVKKKMEDLSKAQIRSLVQRFIRFKSTTDPRVRKRIEPAPAVLTAGSAQRLAGDIIAVAEFYELPLEFLLGIGAMENNYMNVRGDLEHTIWKRRPAKDDIVIERRRGRVRVLNDSAGVWQITRETLRSVHQSYLKDTRDYTKLPEHLRPPKVLNINDVSPDVLTTYAGLLLRELLDHFDGDVGLAVGAYNGGTANPNKKYEQGVRTAAMHARDILEHAAALNGQSVAHMSWLRSR